MTVIASVNKTNNDPQMDFHLEENPTGHYCVRVAGNLTFERYRGFLDVVAVLPPSANALTIDLCQVDYLDSAALGMLVRLRHRFRACRLGLRIRRGSMVDTVLEVANFGKLFDIKAA